MMVKCNQRCRGVLWTDGLSGPERTETQQPKGPQQSGLSLLQVHQNSAVSFTLTLVTTHHCRRNVRKPVILKMQRSIKELIHYCLLVTLNKKL